jgi:sugar phosphate isomerase/epimerase
MLAATAAGAALAGRAMAGPAGAIRLGGPIFVKSADPAELAKAHRALGYTAAYCPELKLGETERIRATEAAFRAENVVISEVGAWVNLLDLDAVKRAGNQKYVESRLALAEAVGATCCVDIAGSYNPTAWDGPDPKNLSQECFDATVENCRKLIDAVKPKRTKFCIEMMGWTIPDTAESYLKLIRAVDRAAFGVHIDVCNIINSPRKFYSNGALIRETIAKLGRWILSCHAKDLEFVPEMNVHFVEVIPGRGAVDYRAYLEALAALGREVPLMLEHFRTAEQYAEGAAHVRKVAAECGVRLVA